MSRVESNTLHFSDTSTHWSIQVSLLRPYFSIGKKTRTIRILNVLSFSQILLPKWSMVQTVQSSILCTCVIIDATQRTETRSQGNIKKPITIHCIFFVRRLGYVIFTFPHSHTWTEKYFLLFFYFTFFDIFITIIISLSFLLLARRHFRMQIYSGEYHWQFGGICGTLTVKNMWTLLIIMARKRQHNL